MRLQLESRTPCHDSAEVLGVDVHQQRTREAHRDLTMPETRRLPHHPHTTDELGVLRDVWLEQFVGGHERCHGGNVSVLGGHRQAICKALSTRSQTDY